MTNLEFINEYRNMKSVGDFCKILGIVPSNLVQGRSTKENENKVSTLCKFEIIRLYQEVVKDNVIKTNSL